MNDKGLPVVTASSVTQLKLGTKLLKNGLQVDFTSNSREQIYNFTVLCSPRDCDLIDCLD